MIGTNLLVACTVRVELNKKTHTMAYVEMCMCGGYKVKATPVLAASIACQQLWPAFAHASQSNVTINSSLMMQYILAY